MPFRDIVVIGASAGGIHAIVDIVRQLGADFPASVFVVVHISPTSPGILPTLLDSASDLPAYFAQDREPIRRSRIYVAPPDFHLLLGSGFVELSSGPRENNFRPAVDPLFRSAAESYGPRVIGVVLSGRLYDGTIGLSHIKKAGGTAVVQDPTDAAFNSMPQNAIRNVNVDYVLPTKQMGELLNRLVREPIDEETVRSREKQNSMKQARSS
jgi:two-component system, chemotaxis family, protein-glutamate methylesterase/glutaminase